MKQVKGADGKPLLELLAQWSSRHDLQGDPYLNSITQAIAANNSLELYSTLDPQTHLPRPLSKVGRSFIRTARTVAITRNSLVFLPVAFTWKAVSESTRAFSEFLAINSAAPVNFLEFWQNGYGILDPKWRIATVAEIDFWIIIAIILMTLFASLAVSYGQDLDNRNQEELDKEREAIVFALKSYLYTPDVSSPAAMDESLRNSLRNLNAVTQSLSSAAFKLERSIMGQKRKVEESLEISKEFMTFQKRILKIVKDSASRSVSDEKLKSSRDEENATDGDR